MTSGRRVESPVDRSSLPTLLANRFASTSSTDVRRILPLTRLTFKLNPHLLNDENECRIFPLDWSKEIRNFDRYYDIVLAAECCYNRDTSKNLFSLINWLFREEKIKMAIQINGKTREIIDIEKGLNEKEVLKICKNNLKIKSKIQTSNISKTIFVKDRIINLIIKK